MLTRIKTRLRWLARGVLTTLWLALTAGVAIGAGGTSLPTHPSQLVADFECSVTRRLDSRALNDWIDRWGVLDADGDNALATGRRLWLLRSDRIATPWAGRWLVVVDSARSERPAWSPQPLGRSADAGGAC